MTRRWISEVPSKIVKILASRAIRSTGYSRVKPLPPRICIAWPVTRRRSRPRRASTSSPRPGRTACPAGPSTPRRHQQPGGLDRGRHVGERERDRLVLDDRLAELLARLRVVQRDLVGRPGDADRLGADGGPGPLEGRHRRAARVRLALAGLGEAGVELLLAAEQAAAGTRTSSSTTSAVWEARMPCLANFWPWLKPLVPGGITKLAWPRVRSSGSTDGGHRRGRRRCRRWWPRSWCP